MTIPARADLAQVLNRALADLRTGRGSLLFLRGEAGMGKSHAVSTLAEAAKSTGQPCVRVDCTPPIGSVQLASIQPLQPFGRAIELLYMESEQAAKKRLAMNIGMSLLASLPIAGDIFYAVKAITQDVDEYKRETAALQQKKRTAVVECIEALERAAHQQAFVLLVDDAHWSDPQSIEVLRLLAARITEIPMLLVCTVTSSLAERANVPLATLLRDVPSLVHNLSPLSPQGVDEVLTSISPAVVATEQQRTFLYERTAGSPGILMEYIQYLRRTQQIAPDGAIAPSALDDQGLKLSDHPATDILLHDVPPDDAMTLALCAAEGRECTAFMVAALMNVDVLTAIRTLRRLEHSTGMIRSIGMRTRYGVKTTVYEFTQSVAYTFFLHYPEYEERRHVHQRIAEILTREHDASAIQEVRHQLAAIIAAHSLEIDDTVTAARMLQESYDGCLQYGSPETARVILQEYLQQPTFAELRMEPTATEPVGEGSSPAAINERLRSAATALLDGAADRCLSQARMVLDYPGCTTSERIEALCLAARACNEMGAAADAIAYVDQASQLPDVGLRDQCLLLNVRAVLAMQAGDVELARMLLHDAAQFAQRLSASTRILTLSNIMLLQQQTGEPVAEPFQRTVRTMVEDRSWSGFKRDLSSALSVLSAVLLVLISVAIAHAQAPFNPHERLMERAHPTPVQRAERMKDDMPMVPFIDEPAVFPSMFTNVLMITEENDPLPVQNESSIAVNPLNPRNLIGSAVDYRNNSSTKVYCSSDAGRTWANVDLGQARPGWRSSNDPSVCFDHLGRGYLCYGGFNRQGNAQFGENGVFVSMTDDGGATWATTHIAVIIHTGQQTADSAFEDKYYIHADTAQTSPYRGNLYIPWKRVINSDSSTQIVIARSTDRGRTWLPPVAVSDRFPQTSEHPTFGQSFPLARTGPDGSVHLVWNSGTEQAIRYARSTDGGQTWTAPRILHRYNAFGKKSEVAGNVNSRVKGVVRAEAYPTLAIDNTGGPFNGTLYLCWSADSLPNIYMSRSTDNGQSWSDPMMIHPDDRFDQFWPWTTVDPVTGHVATMYFDSRDDSANILVNAYVSLSTDGGTTWIDRRVGDDQNDLRRNPFAGNTFAGDYNGCDFYNGIVYPSWIDTRFTTPTNASDNDVFTAIVNTRAPEAPSTFRATTIAEVPTEIDLTWSAVDRRTFGQPLATDEASYILTRDGIEIAQVPLSTLSYRDTGLTIHQEYQYTLRVVAANDTSAVRRASAFAGGSRQPDRPVIVGAAGQEDGSIVVTATLPTRRRDGTTRLTNLTAVDMHAGAFTQRFDVAAQDTGRTMDFRLQAPANGWYHVSAQARDANNETSLPSDTTVVYTGSLTWQRETFDTMPNLYVISGLWDRVTNFAYSEPASLHDTPQGDYAARSRDTVMLYPHRIITTAGTSGVLSYRVAAFYKDRDSAIVEYAWDAAGPWILAKAYNETTYARWGNPTLGDDAWLFDAIVLEQQPTSEDTLYVRLRTYANITGQADGMYIDDVSIDVTSSVQERTATISKVYPQPARTHVVADLSSDLPIDHCELIDLTGSVASSQWQQTGRTLLVDIRSVPPGVYTLVVRSGRTLQRRSIQVLR